jgi:hypothetical protein
VPWTFYQVGDLVGPDDLHHAAYAGHGAHKNDPESQQIHYLGPLPCGVYRIGDPINSPKLGPLAFPLIPDVANEMFGRVAFYIHADSITHPGEASDGCICTDFVTRQKVHTSGDRMLVVKSRPAPPVLVAVDPGIEAE